MHYVCFMFIRDLFVNFSLQLKNYAMSKLEPPWFKTQAVMHLLLELMESEARDWVLR